MSAKGGASPSGALADPANRAFLEALASETSANPSSKPSWAVESPSVAPPVSPIADHAAPSQAVLDSVRAIMLIRAYRVCGHLTAKLDPLGLGAPASHPELDPKSYGFDLADYDRPIFLDNVLGLPRASLRDILAILKRTYCGTLGVEFMHLTSPEEKSWVQRQVEAPRPHLTRSGRKALLEKLIEVESFEKFLARKYTGTKRFGLDGAETMIPAIDHIIAHAAELGVREVALGMAHRGRLNVLAHIMGKPAEAIFHEFAGGSNYPDDVEGSGDVKYHLGASADRVFGNHRLHLSLSANPSHLEAVDPVVLGKCRAKQDQSGDEARTSILPLLIHGDAAFAGQGIVAEAMAMSGLKGHRTGGSVHLIINNQIGFTTAPHHARSSPYPSDVAKTAGAPIFHANGDDPEAVLYACELALRFRQRFRKPVVVDMFCYRRFGHNESDDPMFTQPLMYQKIRRHASVPTLYAEKLAKKDIVSEEASKNFTAQTQKKLDEAYARRDHPPDIATIKWLKGRWEGYAPAGGSVRRGQTGYRGSSLRELARTLYQIPQNFTPHPMAKRMMAKRLEEVETGASLDWAQGEALAFASLLREGYAIRLVGQDSERGTFSQRHSVLIDQHNENRFIPLSQIKPQPDMRSTHWGGFEVVNSLLSEQAVLGFEFGYSQQAPKALVLWEAQFGDFANNAQTIIDQFIVSGESKWLRMSGLVMLLPHGYEGQGPEHSSARLERFLQLCAQDNIQVANCTTPANYFHILRRQIHRPFRKPLILMTPKSLLRHPACRSSLEAMGAKSSFHRILPDSDEATALHRPRDIRRVVLCSGKIYYDLLAKRREMKLKSLYLLRIEQLYPFPLRALARSLAKFAGAKLIWCQEEPENMGAWQFVRPRIEQAAKLAGMAPAIAYAGRPAAASPATGLLATHQQETEKILHHVFSLRPRHVMSNWRAMSQASGA